ncbi:competence protein CoiA family protein [Planococcus beigongshangi]|uniref:competence protein CoiA family protein n=1 Tax=Planococcus beigongshangi TaxID=2782536 RepID=UPI00193B0D66
MSGILIARTEDGALIYLNESMNRNILKKMRLTEEFQCPDCGNTVLLKIGDVKIPHFAHKSLSTCGSSEPESELHLSGKMVLHQFFSDQKIAVELEKYLPVIRQRADLFVDNSTAIEFQCSSIASSEVKRRSAAYRSQDIRFTWISGSSEKRGNAIQIIKLMDFQKEMLVDHKGTGHLLLLNPGEQYFYYYSNLFPISGNRWVGKVSALPVSRQTYPFAVPKPLNQQDFKTVCTAYESAKAAFVRSQLFAKNRYQNPFWQLCYNLGFDKRNLPSTVGVPVFGSDCIAEHTVIWQLKMIQALKGGKCPAELSSSGSIKLHRNGTAHQLQRVLEAYTGFLEEMSSKNNKAQKQEELLYLIYCKTVRKLRK